MRFRVLKAVTLASLAILGACERDSTTSSTVLETPQAALLDGSAGGNPHFYFLPPLVRKSKSNGEFNPNLAPSVEICADTELDEAGGCRALLVRFSRFPGPGDDPNEQVTVAGDHYQVNWHTKNHVIPQNTPFRIVVRVGSISLGHIDLVRSGNKFSTHGTGNDVNLGNGTLPIKFVIERGALCLGAVECFEGTAGPEGGTFVIERPDGIKPAGTELPPGALKENVTLIIERILGECLPTDVPQYQGCYRFRTEPHVDNFEVPGTVGVCLLDPAGIPLLETSQLRLWKWSEVEGDPIQELERVEIEYLECPDVGGIGALANSPLFLARAAGKLLSPLANVLLPRPAYAMARNEGGKLINFSRVGWVRPLSVEIKSGDGQTGTAGKPLAEPVEVRVVNKYGDIIEGVPGRTVTFMPSGNGSAEPAGATTDTNGKAATVWTLATTPGPNSLLARVLTSRPIAPVPYEAESTASATGLAEIKVRKVVWLPPIAAEYDKSGTFVPNLEPVVVIRTSSGKIVHHAKADEEHKAYHTDWKFKYLQKGETYRISVKLEGESVGHVDLRVVKNKLINVATNTVVAHLDYDKHLRIKFRIVQ